METQKNNKIKKIANCIIWIILIFILFLAYKFYRENNFNEYIRSEATLYTSQFKRDSNVKYSKSDSYRIVSKIENDATFYKAVKVQKNTPYKVTCMVKTENVIPEDNKSGVGAQISIIGTTERSTAIRGTSDWQKIEFIFNSKDREEIDIGFRLGGYLGNCTGTAWFSDFTLEEGVAESNNEWQFACLIFENTDVTIDGKEIKLSMTDSDFSDVKDTIRRFENVCGTISKNKMKAGCDIYKITEPITNLTYDEEFGYYVAPEDIEDSIKDIVNKNDYDHIFVIIRLR